MIRKLSLKMVNSKPYVSVSVTFKEVQTTFEPRLILSFAYGKNDTRFTPTEPENPSRVDTNTHNRVQRRQKTISGK